MKNVIYGYSCKKSKQSLINWFNNILNIFILMCVGVLPICTCVYHMQESTRRPEEGIKSPETGVMWVLETELGSSAVAERTLNS